MLHLYLFYTICGAAANIDVTVTHKIRVLDSWVVAKGAGGVGDQVRIYNTAAPITNAMDLNVADTTLVRAGQIVDDAQEIAAGGILRVATVDGGGADLPAFEVYVSAIRVA